MQMARNDDAANDFSSEVYIDVLMPSIAIWQTVIDFHQGVQSNLQKCETLQKRSNEFQFAMATWDQKRNFYVRLYRFGYY